MDGAVLATLFLTGFCALSSSFPNAYYFIEEEMTWYEAQKYCNSENTAMAQIQNVQDATVMSNTPTGGYTDKAWIGLFANDSEWTWVNEERPRILYGIDDQQHTDKLCAAINIPMKASYSTGKTNTDGMWTAANCSDKKPFVCDDGERYHLNQSRSTWNDARISCKVNRDVLVIIRNADENTEVMSLLGNEAAWIGLYRHKLWYWSESGENNKFMNWQTGHPDDMNGSDNFYEARRKTVVRMKIHSSKNMEDPAHSAVLLQQV
ncbi:secretory phospholipase A2 receptor-like [Anarrhichthys ocellatus]|uniref:secretory phospholipase A2 receptor-like n=1 Tax=Anarrhichthys ocellatus TaxID=433405 RepID=UPI0012EE0C05|nr:secretory phospholipase A2 receptor-like [Anarrhichthys ocellatus]